MSNELSVPGQVDHIENLTSLINQNNYESDKNNYFSIPIVDTNNHTTIKSDSTGIYLTSSITSYSSFIARYVVNTEFIKYDVHKIIFSGPCTIVIFNDGSKEIVRKKDGEEYDKETAILYCILKHYIPGYKGLIRQLAKRGVDNDD